MGLGAGGLHGGVDSEDPFAILPGLGGMLDRLLSPHGPFAPPAPPPPPPALPLWRSLLGLGPSPPQPPPKPEEPGPDWERGGRGAEGEDLATFAERYRRRYGDRNRA